MYKAEDVLPRHLPQLMFQAFSAWTESPDQQCLYVGILIGPYLTVMAFNHPPVLGHHRSPPSRAPPPHDSSGDDESIYERDVRHICDVFPRDCAPRLVMYMKHILENPEDWRVGLSAPLRHIFRLAAAAIIKSFEPRIIQEPSRTFSLKGVPETSYGVTADEEVAAVILASTHGLTRTLL